MEREASTKRDMLISAPFKNLKITLRVLSSPTQTIHCYVGTGFIRKRPPKNIFVNSLVPSPDRSYRGAYVCKNKTKKKKKNVSIGCDGRVLGIWPALIMACSGTSLGDHRYMQARAWRIRTGGRGQWWGSGESWGRSGRLLSWWGRRRRRSRASLEPAVQSYQPPQPPQQC